MIALKLIFLCLIFLLVKCQSYREAPVGTECTTSQTHFPGTCQHRNDCPAVKSGEIPSRSITYCNRRRTLICCPNSNKELKPPQDIQIQRERISDRKCREYLNATQKEVFKGSLRINQRPTVSIENHCQHKSIGLIVGGSNAVQSEFPHQAHLGYKPRTNEETTWSCGGSLVSSNFVLTASHCLTSQPTGPVKFVKLGMLTRSQNDKRVQIFDVKETHAHPQYSRRTNANDIALIKLRGSVNFNEHLYPICLPTTQIENPVVVITGFGQTGALHQQTENLMKVALDRFTFDECRNIYPSQPIDEKTMLCYGSRIEEKDACRGDSGGPLQIYNDNNVICTYKQIGIVSFGTKQCGKVGFPGIYVNVFNYIDWIEDIVWQGEV